MVETAEQEQRFETTSQPSLYLDLPTELKWHIQEYIEGPDLRNLRLSCRALSIVRSKRIMHEMSKTCAPVRPILMANLYIPSTVETLVLTGKPGKRFTDE